MINKAIAHLTDQAMKENNPAITRIEEYLTNKCTTEAIAEKLLAKGKSLVDAYEAVRKKAREDAVNGVAVIPDEEVYAMIDDYYGLKVPEPAPKAESKVVNILDLL